MGDFSELGLGAGREAFGQQKAGKLCLGPPSSILCDTLYQRSASPGERDREEMANGRLGARIPDVHISVSRTVSREQFRKHELLRVVSFRSIEARKELFTDHGAKFMLYKVNM